MDPSSAWLLLDDAAREEDRVRRHLLVAAALGELMAVPPIVVGGTAEEYWTRDEYHPTDLDLCGALGHDDEERFRAIGFQREGRHWFHPDVPQVAIEFPESTLDGSPERVHTEEVAGRPVGIIGLDDLYLDRLRQATANPSEGSVEFSSTLAVAVARYEDLDRDYIRARLAAIEAAEPQTGAEMGRIDRLVQRRARRALSE